MRWDESWDEMRCDWMRCDAEQIGVAEDIVITSDQTRPDATWRTK